MSQKVSYDSIISDPVLNESSPNEVKNHFLICDPSIITFVIRGFCLWFSNTSNVYSLVRFVKTVVVKVKHDISILKKQDHEKELKKKNKCANEIIQNMGLVIIQHVFINWFLMKLSVITQGFKLFCYAWTGIMHQVKQVYSTYVLYMFIQSYYRINNCY